MFGSPEARVERRQTEVLVQVVKVFPTTSHLDVRLCSRWPCRSTLEIQWCAGISNIKSAVALLLSICYRFARLSLTVSRRLDTSHGNDATHQLELELQRHDDSWRSVRKKNDWKNVFPFEHVLAQGPPLDFGVDLKTFSSSEKRNPPQRPKSNRHLSVESCFAAVLVQALFPGRRHYGSTCSSKKN